MGNLYSSWSKTPIGKASKWKIFTAKLWLLTHPYVSITPCSSTATWGFERTKYGFILYTPGKKYKKCGKRIHVSWRMLLDL